ncbi:hypothetical protein AAVH_17888 [Aphelenchoides avenae]|nr:hypothetical protein AAVH_17888 [Aphelenchus avenae]
MAFAFLNTSIIVYIYRERHAGVRFQSSFFVLFLAVSSSDLVYCVVWLLIAYLPNAFGLVDLVVSIVHCKVHVLIGWCMVFQAFVHTAVAFNRYCSMGHENA